MSNKIGTLSAILLAGTALAASKPALDTNLEQAANTGLTVAAQSSDKQEAVKDLISRIKIHGKAYVQPFEHFNRFGISGVMYEASGYNFQLKSNVSFLYFEYGSTTVLKTIIDKSQFTQKATLPDGSEGVAYLSFVETNEIAQIDGNPEDICLYVVPANQPIRYGAEALLVPRQRKLISKDTLEKMYKLAIATALVELKHA